MDSPHWQKVFVANMKENGATYEVAMHAAGLAAERSQSAYMQGYDKGYNDGYKEANAKKDKENGA